MKKALILCVALGVAIFWTIPAFAGPVPGDGQKIFQFNLVGVPKKTDVKSDAANGRAILIPLKNVASRGDLVCNVDGVVMHEQNTLSYQSTEPAGAKLHWTVQDVPDFQIADRDALDGDAEIIVPLSLLDPSTKSITFDVWMRVLGKPNGCMNINAWAVDEVNGTNYYFLAGTVYINRATGKSTWTNVNDLFDVVWCQLDDTGATCLNTPQEISVFSSQFIDYFWSMLNDGTRLVQVRIATRPE